MLFDGVRVLVIGDVMVDRYMDGLARRISPEAPVPVVTEERTWHVPGGAANVARNLARLGVDVLLLGLVGRDADADLLHELLEKEGVTPRLVASPNRRTTKKTRILARGQQLVRLDTEDCVPPSPEELANLSRYLPEVMEGRSVVALSDYAKGVLLARPDGACLCTLALDEARRRGIPLLVDPKGDNWHRYAGAQCITPNAAEFAQACGMDAGLPLDRDQRAALAEDLRARHRFTHVLVTRGAKGMALFGPEPPVYCRAAMREVADVSGAGDTVLGTLAACVGKGLPWAEAMRLANVAAGVAVGKMGTAPVTLAEFNAALREEADNPKLHDLPALLEKVEDWRRKRQSVVFTNGCFDLLHPGHISLLRQSAAQGDHLIVGLNSDASVRRLKGPGRPVQNEAARALLLSALSGVDAVILFDEDTPLNLITALRPDVLVKGSDYTPESVVGADIVRSFGGRLFLADLVDGCSTTGLVRKIDSTAGKCVGGA